jgi:hypothetical protein
MPEELTASQEVSRTVDLTIYRAINPRWNCSANDAQKLASVLVRLGFEQPQIVCHPQGDGKGWGSTQELSLEDVLRVGVPIDAPIHLLYWFPGRDDRQNCAAIYENFAHGPLVGYERLYAELHMGSTAGAWLLQLTRIPRIWKAITDAVGDVISDAAPPISVKPPISFGPPSPPVSPLEAAPAAEDRQTEQPTDEALPAAPEASDGESEEGAIDPAPKPDRPESRNG